MIQRYKFSVRAPNVAIITTKPGKRGPVGPAVAEDGPVTQGGMGPTSTERAPAPGWSHDRNHSRSREPSSNGRQLGLGRDGKFDLLAPLSPQDGIGYDNDKAKYPATKGGDEETAI